MALRDPAPTAPHRILVGAILALLLGLISAGCSKAPSETGTADGTGGHSTDTTADLHAQGVKFAACMRSNGVGDFPDPDPDGDFTYGVSVSPEVWQQTLTTCKDLQPPGTLSSKRDPAQQSAALTFADCIRRNGVKDFPDPVNGDPLVDTTKIPSSDSADGMRILNAAMATCRDLVEQAAGSHP